MSKPAELHKLEGTFRADRHSDDVKAPMMARLPKPPDGMSEAAAVWWKKKCIDLKDMGLLYRSDMEVLAQYCNVLVDLDRFRKLADSALNFEIQIKYVKAYNESLKHAYQHNSALGMNPLARTKIRIEKKDEKDAFDAI